MSPSPEEVMPSTEESGGGHGLGLRLRQAREARGESVREVGVALNLRSSVIEALEREDHQALPTPTYVRGYLRSLAKHLELDPAEILALYRPPATPEPELRTPPPVRQPLSLPRVPWGLLGGMVALALVASAMVWLVPRVSEKLATLGVDENAALEPGQEAGAGPESGMDWLDLPGRSATPPPDVTDTRPPLPQSPSGPEAASDGPPVTEAAPTPPARPAGHAVEAQPTGRESAAPAQQPAPEPPAAPARARLTLSLDQESWVEVYAHNGRLLYGLVRAGTRRELRGEPPFRLVIGNPAGMSLSYNGKPVDLSSYNRGQVARLTLGR